MRLKENNGQITYVSHDEKPIEHELLVGDIAKCYTSNGDLIEIKVKAVKCDKLNGVIFGASDDALVDTVVDFDLKNIFGVTR